jgi:excisionase family DNA binding protein
MLIGTVSDLPLPIALLTMTNESASDANAPVSENLWTTKEVAEFLHVSIKTIYNLRKEGLPFVHLGGAVRFVPQEIKDHLAKHRHLSSHRLRQIIRKRRQP